MKKWKSFLVLPMYLLMVLVMSACVTTGRGVEGLSLMDAIEQSAERTVTELPSGSRVAIVAFESANHNISNYIMEELTGALFDRGIEVADRRNLEYVYRELNFQMSGDVSDETAHSIGKFLGADMVITGQFLNLNGLYRYRTSAIHVEEATRASVTRFDVRNDSETRRMIAAITALKTAVTETKYGVSEDKTPKTAGSFLDRGIMFAMRGEYDIAVMDFTEALHLAPDMVAAYIFRGKALIASVSTVTNVGENFSMVDVISIGGRVSAEQARMFEQALEDFTHAIRLDTENSRAYSSRGVVYSSIGDQDKAIADYTQAVRLDPNYAAAYNNRGIAYKSKGDYDRAITDYTQAIRLDPNYATAYINRGGVYYSRADYDRAIADLNQAIRLDPDNAVAFYNRGTAYYSKANYNRAIADFEAALRIDSNYTNAKEWLEIARQRRGR